MVRTDQERIEKWMKVHDLSFGDLDLGLDTGASFSQLDDLDIACIMELLEEDFDRERAKGLTPEY